MSLRDRKNALEAQGFDPKNDKINGYEGLPAGKYHMLTEAISPSKFGQLSVRAQVIEGEHSGQNEFINVSLDETKRNGEPLPDFIIDRNIKTIASLAAVLGVALSDAAWDDVQEMANEFQKGEGKQFNMDLTLKENKNNPAYPYKTYEFEEVAEDPFGNAPAPSDADAPLEIKDEDLPFGNAPAPSDADAPLEIKDEDLPFGNAPAPSDADAPLDKNGERPF